MRKLIAAAILAVSLCVSTSSFAILSMELTHGVASATPIAVVPFANASEASQDVSSIISNDLQNSGRFKVFGKSALSEFPTSSSTVQADYFKGLGTDNVVVGKVEKLGGDRYSVSFELLDMYKGKAAQAVVLKKTYSVSGRDLRAAAHHISDLIYEGLTGTRGVFSTRIAYVVIQSQPNGRKRYVLEIADQDGYNPRPMLDSPEPIMSPSWSPDGKRIAYVSFEKRRAIIFVQDVSTGARQRISDFPGINGAPAWSPDGRKMALVLSKSGSPNIYLMDVNTAALTQLTNDFYINTEPTFSPNGQSLLFSSNRSGGGPQIYQLNLKSKAISRVTFDGDYNARPTFTPDGNHIAMIHKVSGLYKIGILDLDTGTMRVLTSSAGDTASPSVAPNGSMVLYDVTNRGRSMLGMVSSDGRIQLILPARNGDAQDPAWSPYQS
jgi:TolB protein